MESSKDLKESRDPASFVAFGLQILGLRLQPAHVLIGGGLGAVLFAITGNAIWVAILTGLGVAVGSILSVLEANRASSRARS